MLYLSEHIDEKISVKKIEEELKEDKISISAIYRNLSYLEKEGKVKRYIGENTRDVYFQYIDPNKCSGSIHLACRVCGKYYHMADTDANILIQNVKKNSGFQIEKIDSVLYGICENCSK